MNEVALQALGQAARHLFEGRREEALHVLDGLEARIDPRGPGADRLASTFLAALRRRAGDERDGTGNLYAGTTGPEQMLEAFDLLVRATPLVRFGYRAANGAILDAIRGAERVHIVDIGIGRGTQWPDFLERLGRGGGPSPSVWLTGIDIPMPGDDPDRALREAGEMLSEVAGSHGIPFTFEPLSGFIEEFDIVPARAGEVLIINAVLALHHVPGHDVSLWPERSRQALIERLRKAHPRLLVLVEPDAEHNDLELPERTAEAWRHYGLVFDVFDHLFDRDLPARGTLESAFFGREVENVLVGEGLDRIERHQRRLRWQEQAATAGLVPVPLGGLSEGLADILDTHPGFSLAEEDGALMLCWKGVPIVGTLAFRTP